MARKGQVINLEDFDICEEADHLLTVEGICLCGAARLMWGVKELRDRHGRVLALLSNTSISWDRRQLVL